VIINGAWLNLTSLVGTNLRGANLSGSTLFGADLTGADLSSARLNGAIFIGANLNGVDLRGADLTGATFLLPIPEDSASDFSYEELSGDELRTALLSQTNLAKIAHDPFIQELNETNLKPYLKDAILQGVLYNDATVWPLGFEIPSSAIFQP
jgi:uncharacterized protein YjbI with pentapeptide repeats